jgi:signal transduction histidine kinase
VPAVFNVLPVVAATIGVTGLLAAIMVLLTGRRIGLPHPRYALALAAFLGLHGLGHVLLVANHQLHVLPRGIDMALALTFDVAAAGMLAYLLWSAYRVAARVTSSIDEATMRAEEYERARRDYVALMRHRIANPLTVLRGGAQTMLSLDQLPTATRHELLEAMLEAASSLESASADAELRDDTERELRPAPSLRGRAAHDEHHADLGPMLEPLRATS